MKKFLIALVLFLPIVSVSHVGDFDWVLGGARGYLSLNTFIVTYFYAYSG